jgi:hypothetical protein
MSLAGQRRRWIVGVSALFTRTRAGTRRAMLLQRGDA